ncbi:MAG TPA: XTP/dITP diphosphatase [Victivallales bacterium]|nr:XTP/dITP diphosphatase [Victivallales bacterium]
MSSKKLLIASNNLHKIKELAQILKYTGLDVISPKEIGGIPEVDETGTTFEENATLKAVETAKFSNMHVFADDSGLEVEALNNNPGVYSARYAGPDATDLDRIKKLLGKLSGIKNRKARFVCVIAISSPNGEVKTFRGEITGTIIDETRGSNGFGYDPVFLPDGYDKTFAELDSNIKNRISHRANALSKAITELKKIR